MMPPRFVGVDWSGCPIKPYAWLAAAAAALFAPDVAEAVGAGVDATAGVGPPWSALNADSSEEQLKAEPAPASACCIGWRNDIPPVGGAMRLHTRLLTSLKRMKVLK